MHTIYEFDIWNNKVNKYTGTLDELDDMFSSKLIKGRISKSKRWTRRVALRPQSIDRLVTCLNMAEKNLSKYDRVTMHIYSKGE